MARLTAPPSRLGAAPGRLGFSAATASPARAPGNPLRHLYGTKRWQQLRWRTFERDGFTCRWPGCGRLQGDTSQLVADHVRPHRGDESLFWDPDNLQTLCKSPCHDRHKQALEQASRITQGDWT